MELKLSLQAPDSLRKRTEPFQAMQLQKERYLFTNIAFVILNICQPALKLINNL